MPLIGILATLASLVITLIGFPAQILRNYRRKSCDGLAPSLIYSACVSYTLWGIYGWTKPDVFIIISQTSGGVLSFIVLFQLFHYRKKGA